MVNRTKNSDTITVQFYVNCKTKLGQSLLICGGCSQLGNWTPSSGIMLQTNRKNYPQWNTAHPLTMKSNMMVEFKVCIVREGLVTWESLSENHVFYTGSKSLQINVTFDSSYMPVYEKKVIQIECRNGINNIMNDIKSEWGSSIGHPSNYGLTRFHMAHAGYSRNHSQISSNLMSVCDSDQIQLQMKIMNYLHPGSLVKTMSKPCQIQLRGRERKNQTASQKPIASLQTSQTYNSSPLRRSYGSLPKDYNTQRINKNDNCKIESKLFQRHSFPIVKTRFNSIEKHKYNCVNTDTHYSERKLTSENYTLKASLLSKQSAEFDGSEGLGEELDDLFGFEIF